MNYFSIFHRNVQKYSRDNERINSFTHRLSTIKSRVVWLLQNIWLGVWSWITRYERAFTAHCLLWTLSELDTILLHTDPRQHVMMQLQATLNLQLLYLRCSSFFWQHTYYMVEQDNVQANLESVQCRVFQICKVFDYQYCKSRSRDPFPTPLT